MNEFVEATVRALQDDEELINVCYEGTEIDSLREDMEEEESAIRDSDLEGEEGEGDETTLVQDGRPPWRTDSRERSRSPPTRRPTRGDERRGDGHDHCPWRRENAPGTGSGAGERWRRLGWPGTGREGRDLPGPRGLVKAMPRGRNIDPTASIRNRPEGWLQHAWHCVLDMAEPTTPGEAYSYGIAGDAQNNLEATMLDLNAPQNDHDAENPPSDVDDIMGCGYSSSTSHRPNQTIRHGGSCSGVRRREPCSGSDRGQAQGQERGQEGKGNGEISRQRR